MRLLFATLAIAVSDLLLIAAFAGVGGALRKLHGLRPASAEDWLTDFWSGFAAVTLGLMLLHFRQPIGGWVLPVVLVAGASGLWLQRAALAELLRTGPQPAWPWLAAVGAIVLWVANASLGPLTNWDSALYHLQAIRWSEEYPVVPGIANLYGPLAFNNASFLYGALLNTGLWQDRAFHLTNSTLVMAVLFQGAVGVKRLLGGQGRAVAWGVLTVVLAVPAVVLVNPDTLPSYITDAPTTLLMLAVVPLLALEFWNVGSLLDRGYRLVVVSMLLATAVCLKLHAGVFAALAWPLTMMHWIAAARAEGVRWGRTAVLATAWVVLFAGAWIGRGVVQSGYPFFPIERLGLAVDWRAPVEHAAGEHAFILHSGRNSSARLAVGRDAESLGEWFPKWWSTEGTRHPYELIVPVGIGALLAVMLLMGSGEGWGSAAPLLLLIPISASALAWFVSAPAPRYAMYLFWSAAGLLTATVLPSWIEGSRKRRRWCVMLGVALALSPAAVFPALMAARRGDSALASIVRHNFNRPPAEGLFPVLEQRAHTVFTTDEGLHLNVPLSVEGGRCWDVPLPCTPNPAPNLVLRQGADLAGGFRVDGDWDMQDWPYEWLPQFLEAWRASRTP